MSLSRRALYASVQCLLFLCVPAFGQELESASPEPAQLIVEGSFSTKKNGAPETAAAAPVVFSIGDPTDEEQLYLELMNRARADANAEAQRLINLDDIYVRNALQKVNTNQMVS